MSVTPGLVQISKDWHSRLEAGDLALQSPLRTLLLACLIKRLRELMVLMTSTPEAIAKLQAAEWLDQAGEWTYFRWNPQEKKLKRHAEKGTISQPALLEKVDFLLANLLGDIVQKFSSKQKLYEMEEESPTTATFFMSISLRGALSHQVHDCFVQLIGAAQTSEVADTPRAATVRPSSRDCHERLPAQPLPRFTLVNDGNACYINATVYALWHVANCTNTLQHLPKALASLTGRGVHAKRAIQFQLLG